jgi:hypothetical protein
VLGIWPGPIPALADAVIVAIAGPRADRRQRAEAARRGEGDGHGASLRVGHRAWMIGSSMPKRSVIDMTRVTSMVGHDDRRPLRNRRRSTPPDDQDVWTF